MQFPVFPRRNLLLGAAGLGISLVAPRAVLRANETRGPSRPKSLVVVWLNGGPSQLETWDPHPGSVAGGPTLAIETALPGVQIAAGYEHVAEVLPHFSIVRSLVSKEGDHERATYLLKTGYRPEPTLTHPSIVSIAAREVPTPGLEIPAAVTLGEGDWPARGGFLGDQWDAFRVFEPGRSVHNLQPAVDEQRQQRRLSSLEVVSSTFLRGREHKVTSGLHQHMVQAALRMMSSEQIKAFDLQQETEAVRAAYGTSSVGRGCLVARRLIEQGVRAVEVSMGGFDSHARNFEAHTNRAKDLDPALASLVKDLVERDLWASTIMLVIGEFGRTPKINPLDGRDHWPTGFSCLVGGGGLRAGGVIGATDPTGEAKDPQDPVEVRDLYATVLQQLGVDFAREVMTPIGRPMKYNEGKPLDVLL